MTLNHNSGGFLKIEIVWLVTLTFVIFFLKIYFDISRRLISITTLIYFLQNKKNDQNTQAFMFVIYSWVDTEVLFANVGLSLTQSVLSVAWAWPEGIPMHQLVKG